MNGIKEETDAIVAFCKARADEDNPFGSGAEAALRRLMGKHDSHRLIVSSLLEGIRAAILLDKIT